MSDKIDKAITKMSLAITEFEEIQKDPVAWYEKKYGGKILNE